VSLLLGIYARKRYDEYMISAVILTRNNAETLERTLGSLKALDEVVVVDNGSVDATLEIAKAFKRVKIIEAPFTTFGKLRNLGADAARNEWILAIDSDEVLTGLLPKPQMGHIYSFPFHNFYNGKWIRWCGWYPDRHARLYNRNEGRFSLDAVHEKLVAPNCATVASQTPINHFSYRSPQDFTRKMHLYSDLFAKEYAGKRSASLFQAIVHGAWAFIKSYIVKRGFLGGNEGYIISAYNGKTAYYKYLKLRERNRLC